MVRNSTKVEKIAGLHELMHFNFVNLLTRHFYESSCS